jgi:hypothetical protein
VKIGSSTLNHFFQKIMKGGQVLSFREETTVELPVQNSYRLISHNNDSVACFTTGDFKTSYH